MIGSLALMSTFMSHLHKLRSLYWRVFKPTILGAFTIVSRKGSEVLLVRHTYQKGWFLPGGGLQKGETFQAAAFRELKEECGIEAASLHLQGVYLNTFSGARDHVCVFVVSSFTGEPRAADPREIAEARFFPVQELPADLKRGHRDRILEHLG